MIDKPSTNRQKQEEIKRLLAETPVLQGACDLDLLLFLHRHPRTLLTNEQLAAFVGYDMKQIAQSIEAFLTAAILERMAQTPTHAARMYLLVLNGPQGGGLKALLEQASTRQGRRDVLQLLGPGRSQTAPLAITQQKRRLHAIA